MEPRIPVSIITVAGRRSGRPHSTPVTPWVVDGKRYVIAGISTSDWSSNARAAGAGTVPHVAVFEVTPAGT
jgi:F420H(2)-dependent quinone reductase